MYHMLKQNQYSHHQQHWKFCSTFTGKLCDRLFEGLCRHAIKQVCWGSHMRWTSGS